VRLAQCICRIKKGILIDFMFDSLVE
jgi:hypothetical protein